jgi:hypothetical protein
MIKDHLPDHDIGTPSYVILLYYSLCILIFKFPCTTPYQVFGRVTRILGSQFHLTNAKTTPNTNTIFLMEKPPLGGQGLLITEAFRSHLDTLHVRLLWTSDQPEAQIST